MSLHCPYWLRHVACKDLLGTGLQIPLVFCCLRFASGFIRLGGQVQQKLQEFFRLADEEPVIDEAVDSSGRIELTCSGRANDGDLRQAFNEVCWFGHDQICLERFWLPNRQIDKGQSSARLIVGQGNRVAGLIVPDLEVHDFGSANADGDAKHLRVRNALAERGVETGASLLDESEVKSSRVSDRLSMIRVAQVGKSCGNCGMLAFIQAWYGLRKGRRAEIDIGIVGKRSVILCETQIFSIDESWLPNQPSLTEPKNQMELPRRLLAQEKEMIEVALKESRGRIFGPRGAAAKLGIPRSTLESKIKSLKIDKNRFRTLAEI